MEDQEQVVGRLRSAFCSGIAVSEEFRLAQLGNLLSLVEDNEQKMLDALQKDLAKPKFESIMSETDMVINELHHAIDNLKSWMQPDRASTNLATKLDDCFIKREPLGVVLIIGAWNYPIQLTLVPMVAAIAAGNCVVIKPSEVSATVATLLSELIPKYMCQESFAVVCGGAEDTNNLLKNRFDHIFYTGSQAVARCILQAASVHLTPVTLELGGKCPCLIYEQDNMAAAAHRLAWAKFFNTGQSCVAPDYVLCSPATRDALVPALQTVLASFYGDQPGECPDFGRIVTDKHWTRLTEMLQRSRGRVVLGGESQQENKYIAPTVVVDVKEDDALMEEEIFGPILPIITIESLEEGIAIINGREKPLALYVFSDKPTVVTSVLDKTSSGGFCANDGIVQMTLPTLPFGGVGASGWGNYHGRWGFETFSHHRACLLRGWGLERLNTLRYPPYTETNLSWLRWSVSAKKTAWNSCSLM